MKAAASQILSLSFVWQYMLDSSGASSLATASSCVGGVLCIILLVCGMKWRAWKVQWVECANATGVPLFGVPEPCSS